MAPVKLLALFVDPHPEAALVEAAVERVGRDGQGLALRVRQALGVREGALRLEVERVAVRPADQVPSRGPRTGRVQFVAVRPPAPGLPGRSGACLRPARQTATARATSASNSRSSRVATPCRNWCGCQLWWRRHFRSSAHWSGVRSSAFTFESLGCGNARAQPRLTAWAYARGSYRSPGSPLGLGGRRRRLHGWARGLRAALCSASSRCYFSQHSGES